MPNTKPNLKSKTGNVNHPFTERDVEVGETIYGTHPARQVSLGQDSAAYNAMQEFKNAQTNFGATINTDSYKPSNKGIPTNTLLGLPAVNVNTFDLGSYTNPQQTTDSSANDNSSSINTYSFLDDQERVTEWKKRNPNKNVFGLPKRTEGSFKERIEKAEKEGKWNKVARLKTRRQKFRDHHKANKAIHDTK